MTPNRRQAIIWSNDGLFYWRIYLPLGPLFWRGWLHSLGRLEEYMITYKAWKQHMFDIWKICQWVPWYFLTKYQNWCALIFCVGIFRSLQNPFPPGVSLSGVPDLFDRNKILSGDLSHYQVPHCIRVSFILFDLCLFITIFNFILNYGSTYCNILDIYLS